MCSWSIFGARMNHEHTQTHKTHHNLDLEETTTFPFILFFVISHEGYIQMSFCPETPKLGIRKFPNLGLPTLWRAKNSYVNLQLRRCLMKTHSLC